MVINVSIEYIKEHIKTISQLRQLDNEVKGGFRGDEKFDIQ